MRQHNVSNDGIACREADLMRLAQIGQRGVDRFVLLCHHASFVLLCHHASTRRLIAASLLRGTLLAQLRIGPSRTRRVPVPRMRDVCAGEDGEA